MSRKKKLTRDDEIQIVAELLDVLHQHGVDVDTPYVFENFLQDHGTSEVISLVLVGDGEDDGDGDYEAYQKKPIGERIARYSRLPKSEDFSRALDLLGSVTIQLDAFIKAFPDTHPCKEQTQFVEKARQFTGRLVDEGVLDEEDRI